MLATITGAPSVETSMIFILEESAIKTVFSSGERAISIALPLVSISPMIEYVPALTSTILSPPVESAKNTVLPSEDTTIPLEEPEFPGETSIPP